MMLEYVAKNNDALDVLINRHGVEVRSFPDDVIEKLRELSAQVVAEVAGNDAFSQEIYDSYLNFSNKSKAWYQLSEQAYLNLR